MNKHLLYILASGLVLASCGGSSEEKSETKQKKVEFAEEVCTYKYNDETTVKWTAFKFTDKVGVGGTLDSVIVKSDKSVEKPHEILKDIEFEIYTSSVNSNNEERDAKIRSFFFGSMENTEVIKGKVMEVSGSPREGSLSISLTFNGQTHDQQMKYFVEGSAVTINGQLDLLHWKAQGSVDALNNVCKDLHTGEDGVSKLWTDVDIEIVSVLGQDCK